MPGTDSCRTTSLPTLLALALVCLLAACGGGGGGSSDGDDAPVNPAPPVPPPTDDPVGTTLFPEPPAGDAFYQPPSPLPGVNGDVLWAEEISPASYGKLYKVLYRSTSYYNEPIVVSGWIAIPNMPRPDQGYPVVSFGHGTRGITDNCAPTVASTPAATIALLEGFLARGFVVSASDYQGLGTPGLHQYIVGPSEARSVLDAARAAQTFGGGGNRVFLFGHSQGGHAAIFANELAASYAPELNILGTIGSSAAVFDSAGTQLNALMSSRYKGFIVMAAIAQHDVYGPEESPPERWLTPVGEQEAFNLVNNGTCVGDLISIFSQFDASELFVPGAPLPLVNSSQDADADSMPIFRNGPSPLLLVHGRDDDLILPTPVREWAAENCANRQDLFLQWLNTDHFIPDNAPQQLEGVVFDWIQDRLRGEPAPSNCSNLPLP